MPYFWRESWAETMPGARSTVYSLSKYSSRSSSDVPSRPVSSYASSIVKDFEKDVDTRFFHPAQDGSWDTLRSPDRRSWRSSLVMAESYSLPVTASHAMNPMMDHGSFPEGGLKAWLVVMGAMCSLFVSFGWVNAMGVFQEYYQTHQLKNYTSQEIAWIPSLESFMMFSGGIWIGRVYDNYGPRWLLLIGSFLHVFGLMMTSISTEYYQFVLAQGICSALGASMIFYPSMNAVVTWFHSRRGLALGITASGSSIGGVIFPIMVQQLIPKVGFGWTMRICAFLILALMIVANLTIVSRIPPHPKHFRLWDFVAPFTELKFVLLAVGCFLTFLGLFLPFTFLLLEGSARGVPEGIAKYLISILNAASILGRTLPSYAADKFGRFTVFLIMSLLSAVITLALWLPSSGTAATITYSVVYGISSGSIISLAPTLVAHLSDVRQIGLWTGLLFSVTSIALLLSAPIGGQLIILNDGGYTTMQAFSGAMMAAGSVVFLVLRVKVGGWSLAKKV